MARSFPEDYTPVMFRTAKRVLVFRVPCSVFHGSTSFSCSSSEAGGRSGPLWVLSQRSKQAKMTGPWSGGLKSAVRKPPRSGKIYPEVPAVPSHDNSARVKNAAARQVFWSADFNPPLHGRWTNGPLPCWGDEQCRRSSARRPLTSPPLFQSSALSCPSEDRGCGALRRCPAGAGWSNDRWG